MITIDHTAIAKRLGDRVRDLRKEAGITQRELAERTGILRPNIARLERGEHLPLLETLLRVGVALGKQPSAIFSVLDERALEKAT